MAAGMCWWTVLIQETSDKRSPTGSVLGPILFLIFINDLDSGLTSSVFKFADDTKILGSVSTSDDKDTLQQDLQHVSSIRWAMPHNHHCTYLLTDEELNILCVP